MIAEHSLGREGYDLMCECPVLFYVTLQGRTIVL